MVTMKAVIVIKLPQVWLIPFGIKALKVKLVDDKGITVFHLNRRQTRIQILNVDMERTFKEYLICIAHQTISSEMNNLF